jgi:uncharacterized protein (TIGR03437 family)
VNAENLFTAWSSSASVSSPTPAIAALSNGASFKATYGPGMILSVFGTNLASATESASAVPLPDTLASTSVTINGIAAPFYYASATQLNIQIPYEVPVGATAVLSIDSNGKTTAQAFTVAAAAPGIFTNDGVLVPSSSAARGGVVSLYITGAGALSPVVATGSAPSSSTPLSDLPAPTQNTVVTIGGVQAQIEFIGDTAGLVGVVQLNVQVPSTISTGTQQVVVTIGGVSSAPAQLQVTN